jgi:hypothetical protein
MIRPPLNCSPCMPSSHFRRASSRRPGTNAQNVNRPMAVAHTCSGNRFDTFDQLRLPGSNSGPPQGRTADNVAGKQQNGSHIEPTLSYSHIRLRSICGWKRRLGPHGQFQGQFRPVLCHTDAKHTQIEGAGTVPHAMVCTVATPALVFNPHCTIAGPLMHSRV